MTLPEASNECLEAGESWSSAAAGCSGETHQCALLESLGSFCYIFCGRLPFSKRRTPHYSATLPLQEVMIRQPLTTYLVLAFTFSSVLYLLILKTHTLGAAGGLGGFPNRRFMDQLVSRAGKLARIAGADGPSSVHVGFRKPINSRAYFSTT